MNIYFKAEKMKYRHTFLWKLMILMPAVSTLLSAQLTHNYFAMDGYNWWYMLTIPKLKLCRNFPSSTENIKVFL